MSGRRSAEERLDYRYEGRFVLEQERVSGVGVEHELCSVDQFCERVAVDDGVEPVEGAGRDERRRSDLGGSRGCWVGVVPPLLYRCLLYTSRCV